MLIGNGDGTFKLASSPLTGAYAIGIAATDFNGDDVPDLAVGSSSGTTVSILLARTTRVNTIAPLDLVTVGGARQALSTLSKTLNRIDMEWGNVGALESRFQTALNNLASARENFLAAESRIMDTDIAESATQLTRLKIIQQVGASILAQANQQPTLVLSLLRAR